MIDPLDPTLTANVPEIGKKVDSIPVDKVMEAMQSLETELKEFFVSQALELEDAIARVRELHKLRVEVNEHGYSNDTCWGCYDEDASTGEQFHHRYPCPTIKALDGEQ